MHARFSYSFIIFALLFLSACVRPVYELSADYTDPLAAYKFSCESIDSVVVREALPALEEEYGAAVDCPDIYRDKLLAALSFYPDLKGVRIRVVRMSLRTSMAARPGNFALARKNRRYSIYVDDVTDKVTDFRRYPYSAQVGCFIHELGHVAHYETRSNTRLFYDGTNYVSSQKFRSKYERYADHNAIARGGGYFGFEFRNYTFNEADISDTYRAFKAANYYTPRDLMDLQKEALRARGLPAQDCYTPAL